MRIKTNRPNHFSVLMSKAITAIQYDLIDEAMDDTSPRGTDIFPRPKMVVPDAETMRAYLASDEAASEHTEDVLSAFTALDLWKEWQVTSDSTQADNPEGDTGDFTVLSPYDAVAITAGEPYSVGRLNFDIRASMYHHPSSMIDNGLHRLDTTLLRLVVRSSLDTDNINPVPLTPFELGIWWQGHIVRAEHSGIFTVGEIANLFGYRHDWLGISSSALAEFVTECREVVNVHEALFWGYLRSTPYRMKKMMPLGEKELTFEEMASDILYLQNFPIDVATTGVEDRFSIHDVRMMHEHDVTPEMLRPYISADILNIDAVIPMVKSGIDTSMALDLI